MNPRIELTEPHHFWCWQRYCAVGVWIAAAAVWVLELIFCR